MNSQNKKLNFNKFTDDFNLAGLTVKSGKIEKMASDYDHGINGLIINISPDVI